MCAVDECSSGSDSQPPTTPPPHLAADLNVILLSHQGTESRPWVAKGYSVANEVCTGPVGNGGVTPKLLDTRGQRYSTAQTSAVG